MECSGKAVKTITLESILRNITLKMHCETSHKTVIRLERDAVRSLLSKLHFAVPAINRNVVTEKGIAKGFPTISF